MCTRNWSELQLVITATPSLDPTFSKFALKLQWMNRIERYYLGFKLEPVEDGGKKVKVRWSRDVGVRVSIFMGLQCSYLDIELWP